MSNLRTNYYFSLKHKFIYVAIPKCASMTMQRLFNEIEMNSTPALEETQKEFVRSCDVHNSILNTRLVTYWQVGPKMFSLFKDHLNFQVFAAFRHPVRRFISAYQDKFLLSQRTKRNDELYRLPVCNFLQIPLHEYKSVDLKQFVFAMENMFLGIYYDKHFIPQSDFIVEFMKLNITPFLVMDDGIKGIEKLYSYLPSEQIDRLVNQRRNVKKSFCKADEDTILRIEKLYEIDFELWHRANSEINGSQSIYYHQYNEHIKEAISSNSMS